ncbi:MAG: hypothetical protein H7X93_04410 [Sphingomonadaceae bacterium]|nr:hypothetical protein [Sphingomonadaceae bacterium]
MRLILLLVAAAGQAGCSPGGGGAQREGDAEEQSARDEAGPAATITIAEAPAGGCAMEWDGRPVSEQELTERGIAVMDAGIERIGGIERITETNLPYLRVEASPDMAWSCVRPALAALARTGFARVELRPDGARGSPQIAFFQIEGSEPHPLVRRVEIGADGAVSWDGEAVDADLLRQRADAVVAGMPEDIAVSAAADAPFSAVHETIGAIRRGGAELTLITQG